MQQFIPLLNLICHPKRVTGIQILQQESSQTVHPGLDCNMKGKKVKLMAEDF